MRSAHVVISIARNSRREEIPALIANDHSKREKEEPVATKNIEMINSERIPMKTLLRRTREMGQFSRRKFL